MCAFSPLLHICVCAHETCHETAKEAVCVVMAIKEVVSVVMLIKVAVCIFMEIKTEACVAMAIKAAVCVTHRLVLEDPSLWFLIHTRRTGISDERSVFHHRVFVTLSHIHTSCVLTHFLFTQRARQVKGHMILRTHVIANILQ